MHQRIYIGPEKIKTDLLAKLQLGVFDDGLQLVGR